MWTMVEVLDIPDNRHDNDKRDITAQDCSAKATYV
jgi:hypothetical protein